MDDESGDDNRDELTSEWGGPKLEGDWARGASKKNWDPYVFLQLLKLTTSNLVHKLGLGLAYQKTTFGTKIGGGLG